MAILLRPPPARRQVMSVYFTSAGVRNSSSLPLLMATSFHAPVGKRSTTRPAVGNFASRRSMIKAVLVDGLGFGLKLRQHKRERVTRTPRRRAEHQLWIEAMLSDLLAHQRCFSPASGIERTVVVGEGGILPARFRMTQETQAQH